MSDIYQHSIEMTKKNFLFVTGTHNRTLLLKKRIIHYYIENGDATIADLGREMNLSVPTVTKLVTELQADGYIQENGKQETNGGRKPIVYGLNPKSGYFIGVDLGRDQLYVGVVDFKGDEILYEERIPFTPENTAESIAALCGLLNQYIDGLPIDREHILAVGLNISGRVNPETGHSYSILYVDGQPLAQTMEQQLQLKVFIENDTRAMAYGEYMKGNVENQKNVLFINMSWGLGMGIIIDGKAYYGKSGFSGELGHFCMFENEVLCHCGKKGCLETEASGSALHRKLYERFREGSTTILASRLEEQQPVTLADILEAVKKEDVLLIEILEEMGTNLGKGVAGLINIFNPELVILGGILSQTRDYIYLPIKSAIRKYSLNLVNQDTDLHISALGEKAGLLGACLLSRNRLLN